jgi:hypothetical protein
LVLCETKFDFRFETEVNDLIAIKREAFNTILEFAGIIRKDSPNNFMTQQEREQQLKEMAERLRSPTAEDIQNELVGQLQQEIENDKNETGNEKKKKKGMFYRMRQLFKKSKCLPKS